MNNSNQRLTSGIQIVVTLFAAFGAVLGDFLPSQIDHKAYIYGLSQFFSLLLFLIIKITLVKSRTPATLFRWRIFAIVMSVCFVATGSLYYIHSRNHLKSVPGVEGKVISGELTNESLARCKDSLFIKDNHRNLPCDEALLDVGIASDAHLIWTSESIEHNTDIFVLLYVLIVSSVSAAVFSLIELFPLPNSNKDGF